MCASLDGKSRVRRNGRGQDIVRERAGKSNLARGHPCKGIGRRRNVAQGENDNPTNLRTPMM